MHVVYVISPGGGPEAYVRTLLPWLERRGDRVSIVYQAKTVDEVHRFPSQVHTEFAPKGSAHYYLGKVVGRTSPWPRWLRAWESALAVRSAVAQIHDRWPVDVIEVTEGSIVTLLRRRWKIVLRAHGADWSFRHFCADEEARGDHLLVRQEAAQLAQSEAVAAISQHLADHLAESCRFPRNRIDVIPYGIDLSEFGLDGPIAKLDGDPVLLSVGRLQHRKGTDTLVKAMPLIWNRFPAATLYLLGGESQYRTAQLRALLPEEAPKRVVFPGFVAHEHVADYYRAADLYLAPTQYETFGYTILEAMACGKPVISCAVGAVPELLDDGMQGAFVAFDDPVALADKVVEVLSQPELLVRMGRAARAKALHYNNEEIATRMAHVYERCMGGDGPPPQ